MPRGKISSSPGKGALVATWHYEYKGIPQDEVAEDPEEDRKPSPKKVKGIKVEVELRLHKKFADSADPPLAVREVWFTLTCKNPKISFEGSDIEALRVAMWDRLDKQFEVKWEDYYLVQIRPENAYTGIGTGFVFFYSTVYKGTAWDGTLLLREWDRYQSKEIIKPWPGEFTDKNEKVIACIPATKENREALEEFRKRIDLLREKLADYLRPDIIEQTLLQMSRLRLLPMDSDSEE
jgi:hypothetical protein